MASNSFSSDYSFLNKETFNQICLKYTSERKNAKGVMFRGEYEKAIIVLKNPQTLLFSSKFKNWVLKRFQLFHVGTIQELNLRGADTGAQVCPVEDWYDAICSAHQTTEHGGQNATWNKVSKKKIKKS